MSNNKKNVLGPGAAALDEELLEFLETGDELTQSDKKVYMDVISSTDKDIFVTRNHKFKVEINKIRLNFSPHAGDVVAIDAKLGEDGLLEIWNVRLNRMLIVQGKVRKIQDREGYIIDADNKDRLVYFTKDVTHMLNIGLHDEVSVLAAEYDDPNLQNPCKFRAHQLFILRSNILNPGGSNIPQLKLGTIAFNRLEPEITLRLTKKKTVTVVMTNTLLNQTVEIRNIQHAPNCPDPQFEPRAILPIKLRGHEEVKVDFSCTAKNVGKCVDIFFVTVLNIETEEEEICGFVLTATVEIDAERLPDKRNQGTRNWKFEKRLLPLNDQTQIIPAPRVNNSQPFRKRVLPYEVPAKAIETANSLSSRSKIRDELLNHFPKLEYAVTEDTYEERFHDLLYLEECEKIAELRNFDIPNVKLLKAKNSYPEDHVVFLIDLPGFGEHYSVVIEQDQVTLFGKDVKEPAYKGTVVKKAPDYIEVHFHPRFLNSHKSSDLYTLRFEVNRTPIKILHSAVDAAVKNLSTKILFPTSNMNYCGPQVAIQSNSATPLKEIYNKSLNENQLRAVKEIVLGVLRPYPYIIFGPPGTGKTITVVEAALQIFHRLRNSRILIAAPSNSAADLLSMRLLESKKVNKGEMTRLCALHYENFLPKELKEIRKTLKVTDEDNGTRIFPLYERIVVSTLAMAGRLALKEIPDGFTHVFVDEAGQATEPQTMQAIALFGTPHQVVLAGDPKQLGPVVLGKTSEMAGLWQSYQHRLLNCAPYVRSDDMYPETQGYNPHLVTMLVKNYRSLPALLEISSKLFYDNLLESQICPHDSKETKLLLKFKAYLPNRYFHGPPPLSFCGVKGVCEQEEGSPSWYNDAEAYIVCEYVKNLYNCGFSPSDIGIITPYRKQAQKIMNLLKKKEQNMIARRSSQPCLSLSQLRINSEEEAYPKIGTVEEFQGQERNVILFSAVRCGELGSRDQMAFFGNPHRVNTAITRARCIMIIFGDPHVLSKFPPWFSVIKHCVRNNACNGCDLPFELRPRQ